MCRRYIKDTSRETGVGTQLSTYFKMHQGSGVQIYVIRLSNNIYSRKGSKRTFFHELLAFSKKRTYI